MGVVPASEPKKTPSLVQRLKRVLAERARRWADQALLEVPPHPLRRSDQAGEMGAQASRADSPDAPPAEWLEYIRQRAPHLIVGGQFRPASGGTFGPLADARVAGEAEARIAASRRPSARPAGADLRDEGDGIRTASARTNEERRRSSGQARPPMAQGPSSTRQASIGAALWPRGRRQGAALRTTDRSARHTIQKFGDQNAAVPAAALATADADAAPRTVESGSASESSSWLAGKQAAVRERHRSDVVGPALDSPAERLSDLARTLTVTELHRRTSRSASPPRDAESDHMSEHRHLDRPAGAVQRSDPMDSAATSRAHGLGSPGLEPVAARARRSDVPSSGARFRSPEAALAPEAPLAGSSLAERRDGPPDARHWPAPRPDGAAAPHPLSTPSSTRSLTRSWARVPALAPGERPGPRSDGAIGARWPTLPELPALVTRGPDGTVADLEARERRARLRREQIGGGP